MLGAEPRALLVPVFTRSFSKARLGTPGEAARRHGRAAQAHILPVANPVARSVVKLAVGPGTDLNITEIVSHATAESVNAEPAGRQLGREPHYVPVARLGAAALRLPIAGHISALHTASCPRREEHWKGNG